MNEKETLKTLRWACGQYEKKLKAQARLIKTLGDELQQVFWQGGYDYGPGRKEASRKAIAAYDAWLKEQK